jgi:hypothetical protein
LSQVLVLCDSGHSLHHSIVIIIIIITIISS